MEDAFYFLQCRIRDLVFQTGMVCWIRNLAFVDATAVPNANIDACIV
jgi:hypothetical protein